ncbi:hypothetical protein D3C85_164790 [compost metagenome]
MEQSAEKIPIPLEHVHGMTEYFNALRRSSDDYASLILASDDLFKCYYEVSDATVLRARATRDEIPDFDFYEADKQQALEQFFLLPLRQFGSFVDETYPFTTAKEWYDRTVQSVLHDTSDHTDNCMVISYRELPSKCSKSIQCPRKVVSQLLTEPASQPCFDELGYAIDFENQTRLVDMKLATAKKHNLESSMTTLVYSERFHKLAALALEQGR